MDKKIILFGAGFAFACYVFIPDFNLLFNVGIYRTQSNFLNNAQYSLIKARYFLMKIIHPELVEWEDCRYKYLGQRLNKTIELDKGVSKKLNKDAVYLQLINPNNIEYLNSICGEKPKMWKWN